MSSSTPEQVQATPPGGDPPPPPRRGGLYRALLLATVLTVALAAAVAIPAYLVLRKGHTSALAHTRVSGIPASVSTSLANLMVLSPVPADRAPGFTLTDQNGTR